METNKNAGYLSGRAPKYENIALPDELRGNVKNYKENIYQSPIKTSAGDVHFSGGGADSNVPNYFGHTRIEDMADNKTRRVIEVQSDLYQKGNLEQELPHKIDYSYLDSSKIKQKPNNGLFYVEDSSGTPVKFAETKAQLIKDLSGEFDKKELKRIAEVKKLQQYNDPTAHFRMVREEIKKAAEDGKTKLQFPTGETAMKIEGLGQGSEWRNIDAMTRVTPENVKVGQTVSRIDDNMDDWIVTDVLGDGKFRAIPKRDLEISNDYEMYTKFKDWGHYSDDTGELNWDSILKDDVAMKKLNDSPYPETFDISGKVDTNNPIYKFYEKEMQKYLSKFGGKKVVDENGVSWIEVPIKKEWGKMPVEAFGKIKTNPLYIGAGGSLAGTIGAGLLQKSRKKNK